MHINQIGGKKITVVFYLTVLPFIFSVSNFTYDL